MKMSNNPEFNKKISQLKKIEIGKIQSCLVPIIDLPIGALDSKKIAQRAVYFLSYNLVNIKAATDRIVEVFEKRELNIKKLIEEFEDPKAPSLSEGEVVEKLKGLLISEEELKKQISEKVNGADKKPIILEHDGIKELISKDKVPKGNNYNVCSTCKHINCVCDVQGKLKTDSQNAE